jgi:formylglycine-generating enzyme required for sulfatase activity
MTLSTSLIQPLEKGQPIKLVKIPAGQFLMGSPAEEKYRFDDEGPQHLVKLKSFFLGQTTVTQAQWRVVADGPKIQLDLDPAPSRFQGPNRPVEHVSWQEAMEFCQRLSQHTSWEYSLPSEAQWEYACRAETTTPFAFGETLTPEVANYNGNYSYASGPERIYKQETTDVCSFPANAWGLHDMHGNVWEWCADYWHRNYDNAPTDGSPWIDDSGNNLLRVLRGGSWFSHPSDCRSAYRNRRPQDNRHVNVGFRLCAPCPN